VISDESWSYSKGPEEPTLILALLETELLSKLTVQLFNLLDVLDNASELQKVVLAGVSTVLTSQDRQISFEDVRVALRYSWLCV
jgi:hypothetical protein